MSVGGACEACALEMERVVGPSYGADEGGGDSESEMEIGGEGDLAAAAIGCWEDTVAGRAETDGMTSGASGVTLTLVRVGADGRGALILEAGGLGGPVDGERTVTAVRVK